MKPKLMNTIINIRVVIVSLLCLFQISIAAQDNGNEVDSTDIEQGFIAVLAKSYADSIILRWGPTNEEIWNNFMDSGYVINRYTMLPNPTSILESVDTSSFVSIAGPENPILPWSLNSIEKVIQPTDTLALIVAQVMYGSSYENEIDEENLDIVGRQLEKKMRFGIGLLMADRSALAADIAGLRFVDRNVEPNKSYIYYVSPVENPAMTNFVIVENNPKKNEQIENFDAQGQDGIITLFWPKYKNEYADFWIERSSDNGNTWKKLTNQPIVFIESDLENSNPVSIFNVEEEENVIDPNRYYIYTDSVSNGITYKYRISGLTPFADYTDYSYTESIAKDLKPPPIPQVVSNEVNEETSIATLKWEMNYTAKDLEDLAGFTVWEAPHPDSTFVQVSALLPKSTRSFTSPKPLEKDRSHYYLLKAVDDNGNVSSGFPLYMHVIDDVPPAPPLDPIYKIDDSTGVVTLYWKPNTEVDIQGYRVYFSNRLDREFSQLTKSPIHQNIYRDTIALVTLSEKIYYKMQAVDLSHNRSEFSEIVEVKRPDYVPPIAPIMETPEVSSKEVKLIWRLSGSTDVVKQILYRRIYESGDDWQVLQTLEDATINTFSDTTGKEEQLYEYTIQVVDDAELYSDFAFPVKGRRWFDNVIPEVVDFSVKYNSKSKTVSLNWTYQPVNHELLEGIDYMFYVYRSIGNAGLTTYRMVDSGKTSFLDQKTTEDGDYNYAIKVVYLNGKSGAMSEQQKVSIKN